MKNLLNQIPHLNWFKITSSKDFFYVIDSSLKEFKSSNKFIFFDGTFLTSKYRGILLSATFLDSNIKIVVLSPSIVLIKNLGNWT